MKKCGSSRIRVVALLGTLSMCAGTGVLAQVGIRLETGRDVYLRYEPVRLRVTLRNYSGNTLIFGNAPGNRGRLDFLIQTQSALPVDKLDRDANPVADLILGAGETRQLELALNSVYDLQRDDVYTIRAQLGHDRLQQDFRSNPITVEVKEGLPVWSRPIGLPAAGPGTTIAARRVTLLLFHERRSAIYCLRIEDSRMVYGVVRLGQQISASKPECDIDGVSNVHVLFQIQSRLYAYRVYDYNAQLKQDRYYIAERGIPHLSRDPDVGRIMVVGGRRAVEGTDFQRVGGQVLNGGPTGPGRGSAAAEAVSTPAADEAAPPRKPSVLGRFLGLFKRGDD